MGESVRVHMSGVRVGALQGQLGAHGAGCYRHLISSSPNLLCKSVDSPDFLGATSSLRFHHTTPSQTSTVLHRVGSTILPSLFSPSLLWCKSVDMPDFLATTSTLCLHHTFTLCRLKHRRFFTKSADPPIIFLVARTTMQECGLAKFDCYYVIAAIPSHYAVSSIDGSSKSRFYDPLTEPAISYGD
ncbi:hypothetical protein F2Q69_00033503 [Brassica cretica]|uniref:Uncharacterized protein n=1 Tax=Brassica cretica TaxID=69181 RepID=A0A8S9SFN2_BRACR|nr:hypothetical protein F2Q69_00033503 [Brassica cretica]